jgi:protein tyrosine/serine phosphatase
MRRFLAVVGDPARQPVFVHCLRGSDRTGMAVAVYRMSAEGWSREEAIDEMVRGGFGFNRRFRNLEGYLRSLDVAALSSGRKP